MVILSSGLACGLDFSLKIVVEFVECVRAVLGVNLTWRRLTIRQCTPSYLSCFKRINDFVPYFRCDVHIVTITSIELIRPQRDHVSRKARETFVGVVEHEVVACTYMSHQRFEYLFRSLYTNLAGYLVSIIEYSLRDRRLLGLGEL
ncbi:hypothetical protein CY34DRAFT_260113 [Suillus luteus UH-Slu-Lm8-n1]|uniref:Uncharacterized protein n=1 Tax=Suillus luteus UH-Slu-Lm8-n1 TaxID=930992 RepID=A0A0D0BAE6_9AGAM|nr:hypothetical protein CY34DRAFT_260113 [Suillus luteus UH-Slu-Lm8-n1]